MNIDFNTIVRDGTFQIELSNRSVYGNRALLNRFEICFLTEAKLFENKGEYIMDSFAGNAYTYVNSPFVLNDLSSIAGGVSIAIDKTVSSLRSNEDDSVPDTEKIRSAALNNISVENGIVYAAIDVVPLEIEPYSDLKFRLPITKKED